MVAIKAYEKAKANEHAAKRKRLKNFMADIMRSIDMSAGAGFYFMYIPLNTDVNERLVAILERMGYETTEEFDTAKNIKKLKVSWENLGTRLTIAKGSEEDV